MGLPMLLSDDLRVSTFDCEPLAFDLLSTVLIRILIPFSFKISHCMDLCRRHISDLAVCIDLMALRRHQLR